MPGDKLPQISVKTDFKRLPSFRPPRDLKLAEYRDSLPGEGRTRKTFVPNLNVQRKKTDGAQPEKTETNKAETSKSENRSPAGTSGRGERGRGRGRKNFVQSSGIFSEGLAPTLKSSGWKSKSSSEPSVISAKPKPKIKTENLKVDKEEDELIMKELMRDDFLDDPEFEPDLAHCPIELPLQTCKFATLPENLKLEDDKKPLLNLVKIKQEPGAEPINGLDQTLVDLHSYRTSLPRLINEPKHNILFLQIPSCFPVLKTGADEKDEMKKEVLRSLPAGKIGTLKIRKSGRTDLDLGDLKFSIDLGTQSGCRSNLISANLDEDAKTGNQVEIGAISANMIVTPRWESLL